MRSREQIPITFIQGVSNAAGAARYLTWTNPTDGTYAFTVDSAYELLGAVPLPLGGGSTQAIVVGFNGTVGVTVQFLSSAGASGAYGGLVQFTLRKKASL